HQPVGRLLGDLLQRPLAKVVDVERRTEHDTKAREAQQLVCAGDGGGDERRVGRQRDPGRAGVRTDRVLFPETLRPARTLGKHDDDMTVANEALRGLDRSRVAFSTVDLEGAAACDQPPERWPEKLRLGHETQEPTREERNSERPWIKTRRMVGGED